VKERFKRWTIRKVDWWFAYTEMSAGLVAETGFPRERITVVENAADTGELVAACGRVTSAGRNQWRTALGLGSDPVGLYLGAVTKMKRVDFLLDAAHRIRERIPGFQLVVAGMGSEQGKIQEAARAHPWIHYVGHLAGDDKAVALVSSDILLNPGAVGLGVLDSFASGTPYFTTDCGTHGPEIAYLKSGQNGMITADDMPAYADTVIGVLSDPDRLAALRSGAAASASYYSVEKMADRFCAGIVSCLSKKASDGQLNPVKAF
jgi:glycosyltransferase involved in cell wall biosynthesis